MKMTMEMMKTMKMTMMKMDIAVNQGLMLFGHIIITV